MEVGRATSHSQPIWASAREPSLALLAELPLSKGLRRRDNLGIRACEGDGFWAVRILVPAYGVDTTVTADSRLLGTRSDS